MDAPVLRRAVIAGGTGLVGRPLAQALLAQGLPVAVLTRDPASAQLPAGASAHGWEELPALVEGAGVVINLAGEGIADRRWSTARKTALRDSRIRVTRQLVEAMKDCTRPPEALVNASAIGYYGPRGTESLDEAAGPGTGFLPEVCQAWEAGAVAASAFGVRVVRLRIGVVLAREGGALPKMALPIRLGLGCAVGSGRQGLSWIHRDDLVAMLAEAAWNPAWEGPYNATAPEPLDNRTFTRLLARRLHRPLWPVPGPVSAAVLRAALGEMAESLLLQGAFVRPSRALAQGFRFRFPTTESALADLL